VFQGNIPLSLTYFPVSLGPVLSAYGYGPTAAVSDKVAAELASAVESAVGFSTIQLTVLARGALDVVNSPYTSLLYQRLSQSASVAQQVVGMSGLIRGGSASALASAIQGEAAFVSLPNENGILLLSIRDNFRSFDSRSIALLGQAAVDEANPPPLRESVAHALAGIHTVATLPYLATLLDDQDMNLRVEAIGGIAAFANGLPIQTLAGTPSLAYLQFPTAAPYMTADTQAHFALGSQAIERNESAYLSFWKQWWLQHKAALGF